ncbi:MAG: NAD-dependent isocitrate dehydrogenase [Ignavibacteria bacterium]|nr:NAD-dependent isocitrate dehydrogenase [Bacteroidota bacterium]MSQ45640.1 NAD-dependent isocitrate dehydrogenase [Ignavibacteria bacterium]
MHNITLIPGDGIGPSIVESAVRVIEATGVSINWETQFAGLVGIEKFKDPLPEPTLESIRKNKIALKGPLTTQLGKGFRSINVALRKEFDLYINLRPAKSYKGVSSRYSNVDLVVFRENIEEFYSGIEHYVDQQKNAAETIGIITRFGSQRIVEAAFDFAKKNNRKKVTIVHKANIMKFSGGLFLDVAKEVAAKYPEIESNDIIVDNMAMQLVLNPLQFDVIVTTNLFGDILSDLCSGLVGGLGLAPGANIGTSAAIFEAVHGSAPDIAGKNIANPSAIILASAMMLNYLGEVQAASKINKAVEIVLAENNKVTRDLNPTKFVGTTEMTDEIINHLK